MRRHNQAQHQRIAYKFARKFLALIDSESNTKVTVTDIVQKLMIQDEEGKVITKADGSSRS